VCPPETESDIPQWGFLSWDTSTPGGSNVTFRVRTAATEAELADEEYTLAGVAQSTPTDTQVCPLLGGGADCPVDLYDLLGGLPTAARPWLELEISVNPSDPDAGAAPLANSWDVTYSCPPGL
jgi:hypothetical protein